MAAPPSSSTAPASASSQATLTKEDILADLALLQGDSSASSSTSLEHNRHALLALGRSLSQGKGDGQDSQSQQQQQQHQLLQAFFDAASQGQDDGSSSSRNIEALHARVAALQAQMDKEQRDLDQAMSMLDGQ